jgi:hypothetical protein
MPSTASGGNHASPQIAIAVWVFSGAGLMLADWLRTPPTWLRCVAATYPLLARFENSNLDPRFEPTEAVASAGRLPIVVTRVGLERPRIAERVRRFRSFHDRIAEKLAADDAWGMSNAFLDIGPLRSSPEFWRLWIGQAFSEFGSRMTPIAVVEPRRTDPRLVWCGVCCLIDGITVARAFYGDDLDVRVADCGPKQFRGALVIAETQVNAAEAVHASASTRASLFSRAGRSGPG